MSKICLDLRRKSFNKPESNCYAKGADTSQLLAALGGQAGVASPTRGSEDGSLDFLHEIFHVFGDISQF